ncbi:MAG: glycoside hydrolase family 25 protein [Nocardioidaceae bacterium]
MSARVDGVDLSHWQAGSMNFHTAHSHGVKFVVHKASESTTFVDNNYASRRRQVGNVKGLLFGGYHFARPTRTSGAAQARHFLATAKPHKGDLWPTLDFETDAGGMSPRQRSAWVADFASTIKAATGSGILLYNHYDLSHHHDAPLWVPRYSDAMYPPHVPHPWSAYTIWQFSNGVYGHPNTVPGIGHCDINTCNTHDPGGLMAGFVIGGPAHQEEDMPSAEEIADAVWARHNGDHRAGMLLQWAANNSARNSDDLTDIKKRLHAVKVEATEDRVTADAPERVEVRQGIGDIEEALQILLNRTNAKKLAEAVAKELGQSADEVKIEAALRNVLRKGVAQ